MANGNTSNVFVSNSDVTLANSVVPWLDTNFNVYPYWDDTDETKNYERILFKPTAAVQARELNALQTYIQKQNARISSSLFQEGSRVKGGAYTIDLTATYLRIKDTSSLGDAVSVSNFVGQIITGVTSGVQAQVMLAEDGTESATPNTKTLIIKYTSSAASGSGATVFAVGEDITSANGFRATIINDPASIGAASYMNIDSGVFFAKGFPVRTDATTVILDKNSDSPTCRIGFTVAENIITYLDDSTLVSNAQGAPNYAAPGADRLQLVSSLGTFGLTDTLPAGYVELVVIINGVIQTAVVSSQYNDIMDTLARRTYQQSGDFVIDGMTLQVREHLDTGLNNGWLSANNGGNSEQLAVGISPGESYVKGYDVQYLVTQYNAIDKGIDFTSVDNVSLQANFGNYANVQEFAGSFDITNGTQISLYDTPQMRLSTFGYFGGAANGNIIGTARVRDVYLGGGDAGDTNANYFIYLYDVRMSNADFKSTRSLVSSTGVCDIILDSASNTALLYDANFDMGVFPITAQALRTLRDANNAINNNYLFTKSFSVTVAGDGTFSITSASDELFPYATGLLSSLQENDFKIILNGAVSAPLTGTVTTSSGNNIVTGSGTSFNTQLRGQDKITVGGTTYRVASISNSTWLTLTANATSSASANSFSKQYFSGDIVPWNVNGASGSARSVNITSSTSASFAMSETLSGTVPATVFCHLSKIDAHEKGKILNTSCYVIIDTQTHPAGASGPWSLGIPDVYQLNSVRTSNSAFSLPTDGTDVSTSFISDSGATASYYDFGTVRLVSAASLERYLLVNFAYFSPDFSQGSGFFCLNSYPIDDTNVTDPTKTQTWLVPSIQSPVDGSTLQLRNCIDFRPAKTATAATSNTVAGATTNPASDSTTMNVPSGGLHFPPVDGTFTSSFSYYLMRKDLVSIMPAGNIVITRGIPSTQPYTPTGPQNSMQLGSVTIPPYPSLAGSANTLWMANRVYTMHDVGALDKRISALEYYATLSSLEQTTNDMQILDSSGLNRFKNGFIVDPFTGSNVANVYDVEYKASIDPIAQECRPQFNLNHVTLSFDANTSTGVVRTGDLVTLPYTANVWQVQPYATTTRNAAGLEWNWVGTLTLIPETDFWVDTNWSPDVVINTNGTNDNWNTPTGWQTQWNDWQTTWTGVPVVQNLGTTTQYTYNMTVAQYTALITPYLANGGVIQSVTRGAVSAASCGGLQNAINEAVSLFQQWASDEQVQSNFYATYQSQAVTTTQYQTRTGTESLTSMVNTTTTAGTYITDASLEPYMRSRAVVFFAQGMKPDTRLYAFFDSIDVNIYCAPLTGFTVDANGGLDLSNVSLLLPADANTVPSAIASYGSNTVPTLGSPLLTNDTGQLAGVFFLPCDSTRRFTEGTKTFRLTDNITNASALGEVTTAAEASYTAEGMAVTEQNLIISTQVPSVQTQWLQETQTVTSVSYSNTLIAINSEPIVQSFQVNPPPNNTAQGLFVTQVDLYFATKDETFPVTVSIVQIDQTTQQVTATTVPMSSKTLYPSQVNVSQDSSAPTSFVFDSPIFLNAGVTYGFKIFPGGSNPNYDVWVANLGDTDILTQTRVISQPATGTLFVSANDLTYSAVQDEQVKYSLYTASFTTGVTGLANFYNTPNEIIDLTPDSTSGFIVQGEPIFGQTDIVCTSFANGTPSVGQYVVGGTSTANGTIASVSGTTISLTNVQRSLKFANAENLTFYYANGVSTGITSTANGVSYAYGLQYAMKGNTLQLTSVNPTQTFSAGEQVIGQINGLSGTVADFGSIQIDVHQPQISQLIFGNTALTWTGKLTSNTGVLDPAYLPVTANDNNTLFNQRVIFGEHYEQTTLGDHSYKLQGSLYTNNPLVSPVIDVTQCGAILIGNIINNDSTNETTPHNGNATAKYVTRVATLADNMDAQDFNVYLTNYRPPNSDVLVFVKLCNFEDYQAANDHNWIQMVPDGYAYSDITNPQDFLEFTYTMPTDTLTGDNGAYQYIGANGVQFTGFRQYIVKIVFLSPNSSVIPRTKNLRGIALQR